MHLAIDDDDDNVLHGFDVVEGITVHDDRIGQLFPGLAKSLTHPQSPQT